MDVANKTSVVTGGGVSSAPPGGVAAPSTVFAMIAPPASPCTVTE